MFKCVVGIQLRHVYDAWRQFMFIAARLRMALQGCGVMV